jgi:uncharacterized membrane protein HdeD (DUF308 family)
MEIERRDNATLTRHWWVVLLRGLVAIAFGLVTLFAPALSAVALTMYFGAYVFVDGVLALVGAIRRHDEGPPWWTLVLHGVVGIGVGLLTFLRPGLTALALLMLIAAWFLARGVFEVVAAVRLRETIRGEWLLGLSGVLAFAFGIFMLLFPGAGALALVLWIGLESIVLGVLFVALSFRLHGWQRSHPREMRPTFGTAHG